MIVRHMCSSDTITMAIAAGKISRSMYDVRAATAQFLHLPFTFCTPKRSLSCVAGIKALKSGRADTTDQIVNKCP